ncbi:WhiB family transcriptional regulator [Microbacterium testaceum]|uniref:WhiB family transcriptional regulator n=1 Tax=Microbacterium testaceum TaxID=2033 RepID=UPI003B4334B0
MGATDVAAFRPPAVLTGQVSVATDLQPEPTARRSRPARRELSALILALETTQAACSGDDRFTEDRLPVAELRPVCFRCPVRVPCAAFATAARPEAGFWAGTSYPLTSEETR